MLDCIQKVWNDDTLYGHYLTTLSDSMWNFATSDKLVNYTEPDPGTARRIGFIYESYIKTTTFPNGNLNRFISSTNILPLKYAEIGFRRIVGTLLTASTAALGFAIKIIQKTFEKCCDGLTGIGTMMIPNFVA